MAARLVVLMVASWLRIQQPLPPAAQVAIFPGPDDDLKMVWHQAIGQDVHGHLDAGVPQCLQKGPVVAVPPNILLILAAVPQQSGPRTESSKK